MKDRRIPVIVVGLLIAASVAARYFQRQPLDVARDYCVEQGIPADEIALLRYKGSGTLAFKRETVEFQRQSTGRATRLIVELRQVVYFLPWQVVELREVDRGAGNAPDAVTSCATFEYPSAFPPR